jgi:hypothetical protein
VCVCAVCVRTIVHVRLGLSELHLIHTLCTKEVKENTNNEKWVRFRRQGTAGRQARVRVTSNSPPVYQCKKALRRNIKVNCSDTRLNISWRSGRNKTRSSELLRHAAFTRSKSCVGGVRSYLNRGRVTDEGGRHLETLRRDIAHRRLDVVLKRDKKAQQREQM